ncbi:MAG: glycerol-3-phosphate 1-O-acyltransferase PlsY [Gammaproteobacteria bacterium]|nr:glycerol-3-phosphate 1-O-acyltransferase PlsY [Gammaproteobacteria bacterium]
MNLLDTTTFQILFVIAAYLLGSINSAILVSQSMNLPDPRALGSGNPGATNVLRTGNKFAAAITLLGDLLKGFIPMSFASTFIGSEYLIAAVGLAALLGHLYPIYYRFKGGKGVATTLGVLLGLDWMLGIAWIVVWLVVALLFRYSSLAALTATALMPIIAWLLQFRILELVMLTIIALFVFWRHRNNISNLLSGNESKLGKS